MKKYVAPVNSMLEYKGMLIIATGQSITIGDSVFYFDKNINRLKLTDGYLLGLGTKLVVIINIERQVVSHTILTLSIICDIKYRDNTLFCLSLRGEIIQIRLLKDDYKIMAKERLNISITTGRYMDNTYIAGMWDGHVTIGNSKHRMHAGTVYDLDFYNELIMSCSTDRTICIYNHRFEIIHRVYDYRFRIFRCGFITKNSVIETLVLFYNNREKNQMKISKSGIFYYGINENGKVMIFCNDECIYTYRDCNHKIISAVEKDGSIVVGYDNGIYESLRLAAVERVVGEERSLILPHICSNNKYDAFPNISFKPQKTKVIENVTYFAIQNNLYKYDKALELINTFNSYIRDIYKNVVVTHDRTYVTKDKHKSICYYYNMKSITTATEYFIGNRRGLLIYKNIAVKVANDAISGILICSNDLYMSCKDGCLYLLSDIKSSARLSASDESNAESAIEYTLIEYPVYKKRICNAFLEGIFFDKEMVTFGFIKNSLMLYSCKNTSNLYLGTKPSHYHFQDNTFYFLERGIICKIMLDQFKESNLEGEFTDACLLEQYSIFVSKKTISLVKDLHMDVMNCEDISCIAIIENICVIGTLNGSLKIIKIINNRLWIVAEYKTDHRILSLLVQDRNDYLTIYYTDSYGVFTILTYRDNILAFKESRYFGIIMTSVAFVNDSIVVGSSDGEIRRLTLDLETLTNTKIHLATVNTIIPYYSKDRNLILSGGDDHQVIICDVTFSQTKKINVASRVLDMLYISERSILAVLTTDRFLSLIDLESSRIISKRKVKIYNACKIQYREEIVVIGRGVEHIKI